MQLVKYEAACQAIQEAVSTDEILKIHDMSARLKAAAKVAKNKSAEMQMAEVRIRAERRLGEMLREQPKAKASPGNQYTGPVPTGNQSNPPTLADMGIDKKLSSRSQKIAAIPDDEFEKVLVQHKEQQEVLTNSTIEKLVIKGNVHVSNNSGENEWYTPIEFIDAAKKVMGKIDLDPASSDIANKTVGASEYFTKEDDGLSQEWYGKVWMNPPYAQPLIQQFAEKLVGSLDDIEEAIVLVNNATDTKWFQLLAEMCSSICFPRKRVRFLDVDGNPGAPLQGQAILYFGNNIEQFSASFHQFGFVLSHA